MTPNHLALPVMPTHLARFVVDENGCWIWQGPINYKGYGAVSARGNTRGAHREMYLELVGPIEPGLEIDHLCRVRLCVNPAHLEPVTHRENNLRSPLLPSTRQARQTHCKRGHEFTEENTYLWHGHRHCRACMKVRAA